MSSYDSAKFLKKAIESILQQSYTNFDLILIDDASTDGSKEILATYAAADSRIIPIYNEENIGLTKNLNKAISLSKSDYIARMDADDIALPTRLEKQVNFLNSKRDIDLVGSAAIDIDESGREIQLRRSPKTHDEIIALLPKANPMTHSTVMFRKDKFEKIGFYNESYRTTQDYEMWFRAAGYGLKFHNLEDILLHYRMDNNYHKRKSFKYRLYDCKLRLQCYKHIQLPLFKYYYAMIPIILGVVPERVYGSIKKMDPRVRDLH